MATYLFVIIILAVLLYIIALYNGIIRKRNQLDQAFGSVDAMLKKRYDLIPNLVETVKQYALHESSVFTEVTRLRSKLVEQLTDNEKIELHNDLFKRMNGMMVSVEQYPDLKANQNFLQLQAAWNEAEEQIAAARRAYNSAVVEYNNSIQTFPANILVDSKKFVPREVLEIEESQRQNVSAKALFNAR